MANDTPGAAPEQRKSIMRGDVEPRKWWLDGPRVPEKMPGETRLDWWKRSLGPYGMVFWNSLVSFEKGLHSGPRGRPRNLIIDQAESMQAQGKHWSSIYAELNIPRAGQKALRDALRHRRARAKRAEGPFDVPNRD